MSGGTHCGCDQWGPCDKHAKELARMSMASPVPAEPAWNVPCPVCKGTGYMKEAVQGWDVGQPAPECPHCDEGTLDLGALLSKPDYPAVPAEPEGDPIV